MTEPFTERSRKATQTNLGVMLKLYMQMGGVSLRKLAPQIGISQATLGRLSLGGQPDAQTMLRLQTWMLS